MIHWLVECIVNVDVHKEFFRYLVVGIQLYEFIVATAEFFVYVLPEIIPPDFFFLYGWVDENNFKAGVFERCRTLFGLTMHKGIHLEVVFAPGAGVPNRGLVDRMSQDQRCIHQASRVGRSSAALNEGHDLRDGFEFQTFVDLVNVLVSGKVSKRRFFHHIFVLLYPILNVKTHIVFFAEFMEMAEPPPCWTVPHLFLVAMVDAVLPRLVVPRKVNKVLVWHIVAYKVRSFLVAIVVDAFLFGREQMCQPPFFDFFYKVTFKYHRVLSVVTWHKILEQAPDDDRRVFHSKFGPIIHETLVRVGGVICPFPAFLGQGFPGISVHLKVIAPPVSSAEMRIREIRPFFVLPGDGVLEQLPPGIARFDHEKGGVARFGPGGKNEIGSQESRSRGIAWVREMKDVIEAGSRHDVCVQENDPFVLHHGQNPKLFVNNLCEGLVFHLVQHPDLHSEFPEHSLVFLREPSLQF